MKVPSNKISLYNETRNLNVEEALGILKQKLLIPLGSCISLKAERFMGRGLQGIPYKEDKWHQERGDNYKQRAYNKTEKKKKGLVQERSQ